MLGTDIGLIIIQGSTCTRLNITGLDLPVYSLCEGPDGFLYAGSVGKIFKIKNGKVVQTITSPVAGFPINHILADKNGYIWFSPLGSDDFFIFRQEGIFSMRERLGLDKCLVNEMLRDFEGNVWVAVFGKGLYCFYNFFIENFNKVDGLEGGVVTCISKIQESRNNKQQT